MAHDHHCDERAGLCVCGLFVHDQGAAHQCGCGSSWLGKFGSESFKVITLPPPGLRREQWASQDTVVVRIASDFEHVEDPQFIANSPVPLVVLEADGDCTMAAFQPPPDNTEEGLVEVPCLLMMLEGKRQTNDGFTEPDDIFILLQPAVAANLRNKLDRWLNHARHEHGVHTL